MNHLKVFKNTSYQALARLLTSGIGFAISIILARNFGASGYGDYIKITSYVGIFYLAADFGLNAIFLQEEDTDLKFRDLFYLRLLIAFVLFIASNAVAFFLPYNNILGLGFSPFVRLGIFIFSFSLFTQAVLFSANAMFQKKLRFDFWTKSLGVGSVVSLLLVGLFVLKGFSLQFSVLSLVIGNFISVILSLAYVKIKVFPINFNTKVARNFISKSFPLGLMLIFNLIYFRIDSLILSSFKSASDVGIYGLSYLFFDVLLSIPLFVSNSIYPILLSHKENKSLFMSFTRSYFFIYLGLSLAIILPFWFVSPLFSLIKPELSKAILPFHILLLGLPLFFLTSFFQWILITFNKTKFLVSVYFISMMVNILLNFIFIPKGSYIAAATITVLSEGIVFLCLTYKLLSLRKNAEIL